MKGAIKYFLIWFLVTVAAMAMFIAIASIVMEIAGYHVDTDTVMDNSWLFSGAFLFADVLLLLIFWKRRYTRNWIEYGFTYGEKFSSGKLALWAVVGAIGCLQLDVMVQEYVPMPIDPDLDKFIALLFSNPIGILSICLIGPLVEEAIFRGAIERRLLEKNWNPWYAIVISAALFALAHGNFAQGATAFIIGCFMGWVYYRTRSIWTTYLIHALNNSIAVAAAYATSGMEVADTASDTLGIPLMYGVPLILVSILLIYLAASGIGKMTDDRTPIPAPVDEDQPWPLSNEYLGYGAPVKEYPAEYPESDVQAEDFNQGINLENPEGDLPSDYNTQDS